MQYHYIVEGQPGSELFTFVVSAQDLSSFAKLERFNETQEGVERKLNYSHVLKLAEFMRQPNASLAEPILGDLRGQWQTDRGSQTLLRQSGALLLVDDGQHRLAALQLLSEEERFRWQFKVTATLNTPYQERLRRFLQQLMRLKLDTHLVWQIQDRGDLFPDQTSKASYQLAKRLATDPSSPLRGLIRLEERTPHKQPLGADADALKSILGDMPPATILSAQTLGVVNVSGIMRDLRQLIASPHSLLHYNNDPGRFEAVVGLLVAAKEIWPEEWENPKEYFLRRVDGIAALLELFVVGSAFRQCLTTQEKSVSKKVVTKATILLYPASLKLVLGYAQKYDWSFRPFRAPGMKFPKPVEIARQLDSLIFQKAPRASRVARAGASR